MSENTPISLSAAPCGNPSPAFSEALRNNSNRELDWLWAAKRVANAREYQYCLERALHINPNNWRTWRKLERLQQRMSSSKESSTNAVDLLIRFVLGA